MLAACTIVRRMRRPIMRAENDSPDLVPCVRRHGPSYLGSSLRPRPGVGCCSIMTKSPTA